MSRLQSSPSSNAGDVAIMDGPALSVWPSRIQATRNGQLSAFNSAGSVSSTYAIPATACKPSRHQPQS
ncbi:hypothetical protein TOPH_03399 [Tolypocladium ophioglossoides CBS 100239]|uniref:Uncharacterized protein n=1 Tax=Tolypocladium ophioglossoides (strain CBS 100239) TaxID=1163406 RepID=A0A0L0NE88_TOLOC|nr:hypothetical protein TOPH_03399 [Tolypocladium ophioglossoides CBS 100239]